MKHKILIMIILAVLVACGKPPKGTPVLDGLAEIDKFIEICNECSGDTERLKKNFADKMIHSGGIIHIPQNASFCIGSREDMTSDLLYSLNGNRFTTVREFYLTYIKDDVYISPDGKKWVVIYSNPLKNKGKKYFEGRYNITHIYDESECRLKTNYTVAISLFDEANIPYTKTKFDSRRIMELSDLVGQTIWTQDEKHFETIMREVILHIPAGTIFDANGIINGNIFRCDVSDDININMLKSVYLYSDILPSMSLDNKSWSISIMNIKLKFNIHVTVADERTVLYQFDNTADIEIKE